MGLTQPAAWVAAVVVGLALKALSWFVGEVRYLWRWVNGPAPLHLLLVLILGAVLSAGESKPGWRLRAFTVAVSTVASVCVWVQFARLHSRRATAFDRL